MTPQSTPVSAFETDILRAIAAGQTMNQLLTVPGWTPAEVAATLRRHHLAVTETGSIVRAEISLDELLQVALHSPSPHIRKRAARARAMLLELRRLAGAEHAGRAAEDLRRRHREALQDWLAWLRQAETDARGELRRLTSGSPRSKAQQQNGGAA